MKKLLLIDGHNLLFKAFYGVPERLLPNGRPIQGIIGFIGITRKIIKSVVPTHVLIVFDPEEEPSRVALFDGYKRNRRDFGDMPDRENPFSQLSDIKKALDHLGIKYTEQPGHEADDMIASLATWSDCEVIIASSDTDFLQLVTKRITVFSYHGKRSILFNEAMVKKRFGVHPSRFLEYKALVGDKSDNIGGVKGIGPKTAVKVINGERDLTEGERNIFERNFKIIALDTKVTCPFSLHELSLSRNFDGFKAGELLKRLNII